MNPPFSPIRPADPANVNRPRVQDLSNQANVTSNLSTNTSGNAGDILSADSGISLGSSQSQSFHQGGNDPVGTQAGQNLDSATPVHSQPQTLNLNPNPLISFLGRERSSEEGAKTAPATPLPQPGPSHQDQPVAAVAGGSNVVGDPAGLESPTSSNTTEVLSCTVKGPLVEGLDDPETQEMLDGGV